MRVAVVGAGAWGLPAAAELARRGHQVTLVDAGGRASTLGSSSGPTRLWRLSHPDALRVRLAGRAVDAWRRLEGRSGRTLLLRRGLLWRGESAEPVASALGHEGVEHAWVEPAEVGRFFAGLRPDGRPACWQADAGPVLAADALAAQFALFDAAEGQTLVGRWVTEVVERPGGVRLGLEDGGGLDVDAAVVAAGPWTPALLSSLGLELSLEPVLEQVTYVDGAPGWLDLPCLYDAPSGGEPGLYAMPTPGHGYKIGLDRPLRAFDPASVDRTPDPAVDALVAARVARDFGALVPRVLGSQVCTWTDAPDGRFVVDALAGGRVVLACGDSGEGFKFSALMGELLADRVEGKAPVADVASFGLARLRDRPPGAPRPVLGG